MMGIFICRKLKIFFLVPILLMLASTSKAQNDSIVDFPEKFAQFTGGYDSLFRFIETNLEYPEPYEIYGKVYVRFLISSTGEISNIKVLRGIHEACDKEVIRLISILPNWIPAENEGNPVPSYFTIPIHFKLQ